MPRRHGGPRVGPSAAAEDGRDIEGVHQMRVALRRLRTASALLRREFGLPTIQGLSDEAKWLATLLGTPRDWDVFVTETLGGPAEGLCGIPLISIACGEWPNRIVRSHMQR